MRSFCAFNTKLENITCIWFVPFLLYESAQTDMDSTSLCKTWWWWCSAWFDVYKFKRVSCFSM